MKRYCYETKKVEEFEVYGQWADGHIAYSKITINENSEKEVKEEDEGTYYQIRLNGKLTMVHC